MRILRIITSLALCLLAPQLQAQPSSATPPPEIQKLAPWTGKWKITETAAPTPFGPAGNATYRVETRFVHAGVAMVSEGKGSGTAGPLTWTETVYFDRTANAYRNLYLDSTGIVGASPQTVDGNTVRGTWETSMAGRKYTCQAVATLAADHQSYTYEWTYSEDGVNWKPWLKGTATRVGSRRSK